MIKNPDQTDQTFRQTFIEAHILIYSMLLVDGQTELTFHQAFCQTFFSKPERRRYLCSHLDAVEHADRYIDEKKRIFGEKFAGVVKQIQHVTQQLKPKFVYDLDQTSSNTAKQIL